jgi:transcriptional regulator with XRE-family HTH domain
MNAQILHQSANLWVKQAKQDIANRIREFLNETGLSVHQMANDLNLDVNELNSILRGGTPTFETFAVLMLAAGLVMEIKSIEDVDVPMDRNGMPIPEGFDDEDLDEEDIDDEEEEEPEPEPRRFAPRSQRSIFDDFHREPAPEPAPVQQPRAANGRFMPWPKNPAERGVGAPVPPPGMPPMPGMRPAPMFGGAAQNGNRRPPFAEMNREELVNIVREHLWQNEIDLANVGREQLVRFLEDKDRQFNALRQERENGGRQQAVAVDPSVVQLKEKLKKVIDNNPHLRGFLKDVFEG